MTPEEVARTPVSELRSRYVDAERPMPPAVATALEQDPRAGARAVLAAVHRRKRANRAEGQRLRNLLRYEERLWARGVTLIAGVDEAGMAPLAGPVVAAACILPRAYRPRGLDDSKQVEPAERERLAEDIRRNAVAWAIGRAEVGEIDRLNVYWAGILALRRAVLGLDRRPEHLLIDARRIRDLDIPQDGIIGGDGLSLSIAAASILAKTHRDALMVRLDEEHPGYGFARHKGYPTPDHLSLLKEKGACPVHRRSFGPVAEVLGLEKLQVEMFEGH